jgi:hypothetical protein
VDLVFGVIHEFNKLRCREAVCSDKRRSQFVAGLGGLSVKSCQMARAATPSQTSVRCRSSESQIALAACRFAIFYLS